MDMDRTQELEEQVRRLSETVEEMHGRMAQLEGKPLDQQNGNVRSNRRNFLRMGAAAAAGALGWAAVKVVPAAAATGGYLVMGSPNTAANPTTLQNTAPLTPTGAPVLGVEDQNFSQALLTTALTAFGDTFTGPLQALGAQTGNVDGFDAWAGGLGGPPASPNSASVYAIFGFTDAGTGVVGESLTGIGLYARTSGRLRQDPLSATGTPNYSPNNMEQVRDANGVLFIHNAAGIWRRVNSVRTDTADGLGNPFKPLRVLDTRGTGSNPPKAPGSVTAITVAGSGTGASTIPGDAIAVTGNLTAAGYTGGGFLAIMPQGITIGTGAGQYNPAADPSSVNFITGQYAIANSFICGLNPGNGQLQVYLGGPHTSHFIVDITGYIQ
jgi:hypothetical protein